MVVNLGAYHGEDESSFLVHTQGTLKHLLVEADARNAVRCFNLLSSSRVSRMVLNAAVGEFTEVRKLYLCKNELDGNSSILPPEFVAERSVFVDPAQVQTYSLNDIYQLFGLDAVDLLWCDVQGAEREVIRGGREALSRTRYAFLETTRVPFYHGQALKWELVNLMSEIGWRVLEDYDDNMLFEKVVN